MVGSASEGLVNRMELVVASDGSVERVRLVSAPKRMADMMLLSGAKLWKFTPAVKDGVPVRYRTMVSWTVFP
jgi:outer membrane biosynthesis protein TonB